MLPNAADSLDPELIESEEDIISYVILPEPALEYFNWRKLPAEERPPIPADIEMQKQEAPPEKKVEKPKPAAPVKTPGQMMHLEDYRGFGHLLKQAAGLKIGNLTVSKGDFSISLKADGESTASQPIDAGDDSLDEIEVPAAVAEPGKKPVKQKPEEKIDTEKDNVQVTAAYSHTLNAPLVGTFYSSPGPGKPPLVKPGDSVKKGDKVCIVEAMKLFNEIEAIENCIIREFLVKDGESVKKDQPLVAYEPA